MSVEFVGTVPPRDGSELIPPSGPPVQPDFIAALARTYEHSLFDAVQIGQTATSVDAVVLAQAVLAATERLAVVITVPATVADPFTAARAIASLAAMYPGRVNAAIPVTPNQRSRHGELAQVLHGLWHPANPRDQGTTGPWLAVRPDPTPRLYLPAGEQTREDEAIVTYADTCLIPAGSPPEVATRIRRLRDLAGHRQLRFGIDVRPIIGADADAVKALSRRITRVAPLWTFGDGVFSRDEPRRVLQAMTRADGAASPFLGTVEVIAQRLNEYRAVGVDVFHLRGFDPLNDVHTHSAVIEDVRRLADTDTDRSPIVHDVA